MDIKKPKKKKCKSCGEMYHPWNMWQVACSPKCAIEHVKEKKRTAFKKETRRMRDRIKSRSEWMKEAQTAFNAYVRERDRDLPCISCRRHHEGQYHAGHYRSVGASPELRFEESNCHKQCQPCNSHLSGNLINYRVNLIERIGIDNVEFLEGPHELKKYTICDLKEIKEEYKRKLKELKSGCIG